MTVWRTSGVAAGDLIIATVELTGTASAGAVTGTDTQGNMLTVASDISDGNGDRLVTLSGVANHALAVNDKITITFPTAATYRIMTDEVSGVSRVDQQSAASGTGSAFSSGPTGTISRAGEFVFAVAGTFGGTSLTWNPGWTGLANYSVNTNTLGRAYQIPTATGSFTASGTGSADLAGRDRHIQVINRQAEVGRRLRADRPDRIRAAVAEMRHGGLRRLSRSSFAPPGRAPAARRFITLRRGSTHRRWRGPRMARRSQQPGAVKT